jgi:predicted enzyme related to lactoylglutathione lyase
MRKGFVVFVPLLIAIGCSNDGGGDEAATSTEAPASDEASSATTMVIPEANPSAVTVPPGRAGTIIMLKLHVGDVDEAEDFYSTVFGATSAYDLGDGIRVMTFPDGPGVILLGGDAGEDTETSSFIMQVRNLARTQERAVANGATAEEAFEGSPGGQEAHSVRLYDPWGNGIEILELG